jgi:hypothetical protein
MRVKGMLEESSLHLASYKQTKNANYLLPIWMLILIQCRTYRGVYLEQV